MCNIHPLTHGERTSQLKRAQESSLQNKGLDKSTLSLGMLTAIFPLEKRKFALTVAEHPCSTVGMANWPPAILFIYAIGDLLAESTEPMTFCIAKHTL